MKDCIFNRIKKASATILGAVLVLNSSLVVDVFASDNFYGSSEYTSDRSDYNQERSNRNSSPSEPVRNPIIQKGAVEYEDIPLLDAIVHWNIGPEYYASYNTIPFVAPLGTRWNVSVDEGILTIDVPEDSYTEVEVYEYEGSKVVSFEGDGSIEKDISQKLKVDTEYWIWLCTNVDGEDLEYYDIYITKDENNNLQFLQSPVYEYNVEARQKLWTDEQSLNEYFIEQHDIMWNDPEIIEKAQELIEGCNNDYERVLNIYRHITNDFYYDYDQINYDDVFQDDIALLLRDRVAVCEGFANVFVGLCRAVNIPATVSFGTSEDFTDVFQTGTLVSNHAWAEVFIDGSWFTVDFTWDNNNEYEDGKYTHHPDTLDWYLIPVEVLSFTHKILNSDTAHGTERSGSCGDDATYVEYRNGDLVISGTGEIKLPSGVDDFFTVTFAEGSIITSIAKDCFNDCDLLTSVYLPDTLETIGMQAFFTCEDLEYVYIPRSVKEIGRSAFEWCDELAYVEVPDSVKDLKKHAFDNCPRLVLSLPYILNGLIIDEYDVEPLAIIVRN